MKERMSHVCGETVSWGEWIVVKEDAAEKKEGKLVIVYSHVKCKRTEKEYR